MHTAIGMKALWWMPSLLHCPIFSHSSQRQSVMTLVIHDTSYSQAVHLNTKGGERGAKENEKREEGEENRTHRWKDWSRHRGGTPGSFLNRGNKEACGWRQEEDGDKWAEIISGSQLYRFKISQISSKRHTPKAVFLFIYLVLSEKEINTRHKSSMHIYFLFGTEV